VKILFTPPNAELRERIQGCVEAVHDFKLVPFRMLTAPQFFIQAMLAAWQLRRAKVDLVVWNGGYLGLPFAWLLKQLSGIPYVTVMRDLVQSRSPAKARRYLNGARGIISVSQAIQAAMHSAAGGGITTAQKVLYDPLESVPEEIPRRLPAAEPSRSIVAMFGYICELKGQDLLVAAAVQVVKEHPATEFWIVGDVREGEKDRDYLMRLNSRIVELGLTDKVNFLGYRNDVTVIMRECSVVVIPSRRESFGMVAIEAWSQGVPTVAMDIMGPGETHRASGGGILFPPEDTAAFARAIGQLLEDKNRRHEMGQNGFNWVKKNSDPQIYAGQFRQFLSAVIPSER